MRGVIRHGELMKYASFLLILSISTFSLAGGYSRPDIDLYDPESGLYYKAIVETEDGFLGSVSGSKISNVYIFDPVSNKGSTFLSQDSKRIISLFTFETSYENGKINFSGRGGYITKNNSNIDERELRNKILFGTWDEKTEQISLYTCTKTGADIKPIAKVPKDASYHIDVRNGKLRVVIQMKGEVSVKSYEW